jgi:integrase
MRWEDIDLKEHIWTIPAEVTKNKTLHRVPLTQSVIDLINGTGRQDNPWIFPSTHGSSKGHIYNMQKAAQQLKRDTGIDDFRLHDLRRTCASILAKAGVSEFLIGKVLNHTNDSITAVYNRHSYDTEKRQALERWAKKLRQILGIESPEVGKIIKM